MKALAVIGLTLAAPLACTLSGEPRLVPTPPSGTRAATHIAAIDDYQSAVAAISTIFERDLQLVTFRQWVDLAGDRRPGAYLLKLFAIDYFSRFATASDRVANFRAAFGQDLETFEAALALRLWGR